MFEREKGPEIAKRTDFGENQVRVITDENTVTVLDNVGLCKSNGDYDLVELKSSLTARLTRNQRKAFPEIERSGATVISRNKDAFAYGTRIPPTKVEVIRKNK